MDQTIEFATNNIWLVLAWLLVMFMLFTNLFGEKIKGYTSIDTGEAVRLMNHEDAVFLDVREDSERKEGHIPNSTHIPLGKLVSRISELDKHKTTPVVCVCRSGHRSGSACGQLRKQGFEQVYNLRGGIMAWQSDNLPIRRKKG